ncbi:hypothetical protein P3G55_06680 [Leptospira sp. 96542]|nr:hypothetical protein [Leptospira sp. 96542]
MKQIITIFLFLTPLLLASQSLKEAKEFQTLTKKLCAKSSQCLKEKIKDLPPQQRKVVEAQFVNGNVCESRYQHFVNKGETASSDGKTAKPITKQDIEDMKLCVKEMGQMSCDALEEGEMPNSCKRFQEED